MLHSLITSSSNRAVWALSAALLTCGSALISGCTLVTDVDRSKIETTPTTVPAPNSSNAKPTMSATAPKGSAAPSASALDAAAPLPSAATSADAGSLSNEDSGTLPASDAGTPPEASSAETATAPTATE